MAPTFDPDSAEREPRALEVIDRRASAAVQTTPAPVEGGVLGILRAAVERGTTPELLDRLLDVQLRVEANEARKLFVAAVARFKGHAPAVVAKDGEVSFGEGRGATHYRHATLGALLAAITPHLSQEGLSVRWRLEQGKDEVKVTGLLEHEAGHFEEVSLAGPLDKSGNKNAIQAIGSTATYLERYTLTALLGISTGEVDDDGRATGVGRPEPERAERAPEPVQAAQGPAKRALDAIARFESYGATRTRLERFLGKGAEDWNGAEFERLKTVWGAILAAGADKAARCEAARVAISWDREREPGEEG